MVNDDVIDRGEAAQLAAEAVRAVERPLHDALWRIGDAYGHIPAGEPTAYQVEVALPALYDAIADALRLIGHPFAPPERP